MVFVRDRKYMLKNLYIDHNRISYFDQNEDLPRAIIFIHGNSLGHRSFERQFASPDLKGYRLLAIDLPGHGESSAHSSYNLPEFSKILSEFITSLNLIDYILVGHSLGGHVALESLEFLNPAGVMIIGTPPVTNPLSAGMFLPHPAMGILYKNDLTDEEIMTLLEAFGSEDIGQFKKTDPAFRSLFAEGLSQSLFKDEVTLLRDYKGQKAIILGSEDPLVSRDYLITNFEMNDLWKEQIIILEGGHSVHQQNPEDFITVMLDFAAHSFHKSYMNKIFTSLPMAQQQ